MITHTVTRRKVLRGLGTAMALPFLESLLPTRAFGATSTATVAKAAAGPKRLAWIYVPNVIDMRNWTPATFGADYELSPTLKVLEAYRSKMLVISGLVCDAANAHGAGGGDHARANGAYPPGVKPAAKAPRENDSKSILDFVLNDANRIQKQLDATDKQKLDEYLTSVR